MLGKLTFEASYSFVVSIIASRVDPKKTTGGEEEGRESSGREKQTASFVKRISSESREEKRVMSVT